MSLTYRRPGWNTKMTLHINLTEIAVFLSILLRISITLFMLPIFNSAQAPDAMKAAISIALSLMLFNILRDDVAPLPLEAIPLLLAVAGELVFGMALTFCILAIFSAVQAGGEILSFQMGFGFAQAADPLYGAQVTLINRWLQMVATLVLLAMNGHHMILRALVESFRNIPIGGFVFGAESFGRLMTFGGEIFVIAIKFAAPVMAALLLIQLALALLAKFAPQINIMAVSFPLTVLLGFVFIAFAFAAWGEMMQRLFATAIEHLLTFCK